MIQFVWAIRPQIVNDDMFSVSSDGVNFRIISPVGNSEDNSMDEFAAFQTVRYVRVYFSNAYVDSLNPAKFSLAIRRIIVVSDQNMARGKSASSLSGSWDFPASSAFDGSTGWISRLGASSAVLNID